jgi:hypothetical protein
MEKLSEPFGRAQRKLLAEGMKAYQERMKEWEKDRRQREGK